MGRLKRHVSHSQGRWSEVKEKERKEEGDEMTLCLYECLRAVGLQRHYDRFISVGVHRAADLSALTMEDYSILGIRSMEDRTRLFRLVQMVKSFDLENLEYEDGDDYNTDGGDEGYAAADFPFTYDGCGDFDEDVDEDDKGAAVSKLNATSSSKPSSVRRRLDFSSEIIDHPQKLFSHPVGTVHVYASHNRNNKPGQGKGSAIPVQLEHDTGSAAICSCKGSNNHMLDVYSHQSDLHTGANTKPDFMEGNSLYNSQTRLLPKCVSSHKTKSSPATAASKRFSDKPGGQKDRKGISRREKLNTEISSNMVKPTPVYESKRTAGYNYGLPLSSPPAPNKKQLRGHRISVCVRKRPLTRTECKRREADVVTTPSRECVIVHESKEAVDLTQYILQHKFYFDQVFGEESSNEEVYRRTAYPLVQHMLNGGKATCFAYGQTGAGKTHTMLGSSPGRPGLYALAVRDMFAHLSITHMHSPLLVYVSFFEIYCGQLFDLLDHRKRLFAREDGQKVVHIAGLRDVRVDSVSSLLEVISKGTEARTQGMSGVNPLSSRSHALLQIQLKGPNQQIGGRMWFVDLAGSERASDTKESDRQSRMEGAEINQSLLALKECIRSLDQEQLHTPFRQSKLTQVLKDSFVGDSMTCMIANISPGHLATEHTLNTLRYADRVKELRGQGGLRGGRRAKTIPSPKRNLSNSTSSGGSSVGTRGKSPPKKPKLGRQREAFCPATPTSRLATILCSTPKNSRSEEKTSGTARKGIGLEQITPIRGLLGIDDKRGGASGREGRRRRETYVGSDSAGPSIGDQNVMAALALGQARDENPQSTLKGGRDGERRWIEERRQVESSTDTCNDVIKLGQIDLHKVDERYKERERHLRWYHQQLQQFMPSSASSSDHLFSPSTSLSCSSSNQASLSSTVSPLSCPSLQSSSCISVSALTCHGFEEVLDMYRAKIEVGAGGNRGQLSSFPSGNGKICLQTETSPRHVNENEADRGDSGGIGEDLGISLEGTETGFTDSKIVKRRSLRATGEAEGRVRQEDLRPAGLEREGKRRWAWVATAETQQADRMTGAGPADVESHNGDSEVREEGTNASDVPADGVWSTEERDEADSYGLVSTHSNNPVQSPHQRAPAERPLSPACENNSTLFTPNNLSDISHKLKHTRCTSNILPLPLQNTHQGVPSNSRREEEPWFTANANRREFSNAQLATLPRTTPITQNPAYIHVHNHPEVKVKMSALAQGDTSSNSLSSVMDPLSISLLQVDHQVATASFLQGEQNIISLCPLENERREFKRREVGKEGLTCAEMAGKVAEDKDEEFRMSLLELLQAKTSDTMTATDHSEQRKDVRCATYEYCGLGIMKPSLPEVMLTSLRDQEDNQKPQTTSAIQVLDNKAPASPLKPSTCASVETSVMQSISSSVQHSVNTGSPSSCHPNADSVTQMRPRYAHNKLAFSISTPQSEGFLGHLNTLPEQCPTVHSNDSNNSNILLQPNSPTESNSEESTSSQPLSPRIHLSTLEDLYHNQWRVVQAHWEQLEEMETLCRKEGKLLRQQPDMTFGEYVHKLGEIMERKARCVHSMIAQLQPYLKTSPSDQ